MLWSSAISDHPQWENALAECVKKTEKELRQPPDFCALFVSPQYGKAYRSISAALRKQLRSKAFLGCSAGGVIGGGREIEQKPALSLTAAVLPGVAASGFHVSEQQLPGMDARRKAWQELVGAAANKDTHFVILADPFSIDIGQFVVGMDYAFPDSTKVGGLASGAQKPGDNALFLNDGIHREGLVGIALSGNLQLESIVAQGCRPIGEPMVITASDRNVLLELGQKPPMKVLEEIYETLPPRDQQLLRTSLFLGIVMDPTMASFSQGDFLVRNIVGADAEKGALAIGAELREGQTVQFHLRDAQTSAQDLEHMLTRYGAKKEAKGSLLFSCLGRGSHLYGTPDHDTRLFQKKLGSVPLGGFFCSGEVGPVRNTTYIHGYTSCFGIFREKDNPAIQAA